MQPGLGTAVPAVGKLELQLVSGVALAKLAEVTAERKYREGAVRLATLGVLPGRMESGRWSDQHNAKAVYHWIMVRGLVALLRTLPQDDPDFDVIRARTRLAVQSGLADVLRDGGSRSGHACVALAEALDFFGTDEAWEGALAATGGLSPSMAGVLARRRQHWTAPTGTFLRAARKDSPVNGTSASVVRLMSGS